MGDVPHDEAARTPVHLSGTTFKIYRFLLRQRTPSKTSVVQKALGLSSPSVAEYHINKLLQMGLVKAEGNGYVVDRVIVDNVMRIRKFSVPVQISYVAFFASTLLVIVLFLRPMQFTSLYFFALAVNIVALSISSYETIKTFRSI